MVHKLRLLPFSFMRDQALISCNTTKNPAKPIAAVTLSEILRICVVLHNFDSPLRFLRRSRLPHVRSSITVDVYACTRYCATRYCNIIFLIFTVFHI